MTGRLGLYKLDVLKGHVFFEHFYHGIHLEHMLSNMFKNLYISLKQKPPKNLHQQEAPLFFIPQPQWLIGQPIKVAALAPVGVAAVVAPVSQEVDVKNQSEPHHPMKQCLGIDPTRWWTSEKPVRK